MHGPEAADALAEPQIAAVLRRHLAIKPAQSPEIGRIGDEDPWDDPRLRRIADRILADRERLEQWRMRILVGLGHDADFADHTLLVDLPGSAIGACPFGHRPTPDALLVGIWDLVVLAVVFPGLFGPRFFDDLEGLLVDPAVVVVDRRAVHRCAGRMVLLAEHVYPTILVAAGEAGIDSPLGQMIEDGELFGSPDRIPGR